jgi:hypothetical protein
LRGRYLVVSDDRPASVPLSAKLRSFQGSEQQSLRYAEHGDALLKQFQHVENVLDAPIHGNVAGNDRDRLGRPGA